MSDRRPSDVPSDAVRQGLRALLADVMELGSELPDVPDDLELFGAGLCLDSLTGMALLAGIEREFGVDVASEDLNLDCLESFGALVDFVARRASGTLAS